MNAVARGKLVAAIIEAMNNTLDHAHPNTEEGQTMPHRWWMSSEVQPFQERGHDSVFRPRRRHSQNACPDLYEVIEPC
jgi:hypothetical protein